MTHVDEHRQSIEKLTSRFNELHKLKIETEANLRTARDHLAEVQREAEEQFGTSDLNQLREMLKQIEEENEAKRSEYQQSLSSIEERLRAVDAEYSKLDSTEEA